MSREFYIEAGENDDYKVVSTKIKDGKVIKKDTYRVDLRNFYCECKGFWFKHNCIHIRTIIELLKAKGIGIMWDKKSNSYYTNWDYQEIEKTIKEELKNQYGKSENN